LAIDLSGADFEIYGVWREIYEIYEIYGGWREIYRIYGGTRRPCRIPLHARLARESAGPKYRFVTVAPIARIAPAF
jgi:hypothetical protein